MKVYLHKSADGEYAHSSNFIALDGFRQMGWEISSFRFSSELQNLQPDEVVVGYVDCIHDTLQRLGCALPQGNTYPQSLQDFLGRKIWQSTINTIANNPNLWGIFVKPIHATKKFTGVVVNSTRDLIGCGDQDSDTEIWCSEKVRFLAEWRCFVRYGEILDVRPYNGNWKLHFDANVVEAAVNAFEDAPNGYAIDFGLASDGRTLLVEVNEGYSLGHYGLRSIPYAKLLSARWAQLTGSEDYCNF